MLVVDTPAAVLIGLGAPTRRLIKVLLDVLVSITDGIHNGDLLSFNVHGRGPIHHPLALAVANRILPSVAPVLGVTLLPRLIVAVLVADEVIREVERRGLERWSVAQQHSR